MFRHIMRAMTRSIRHKLIISSVLCIIVPAALNLMIYNSLTQQAVRHQAISNAEDSLQLVNSSVVSTLKGMLNIANYVQNDSEMNSYFKMAISGNESKDVYQSFVDANRVREKLDGLTVLGDNYKVTVLLTNDSYFTNYSVSYFDPMNIKKEPWFGQLEHMSNYDSYWSDPEKTKFDLEKFDHPYQISLARTLRSPSSKVYGYVIVTVMEDRLSNLFRDLSANQQMILMNGAGKIISAENTNLVGTVHNYEKVINAEQASSVVSLGGTKYLVAQQPISFTGWKLVLLQPYSSSIVNLSSIFNRVLVIQLLSFTVFLLLLIALVRAFTNPLVRLGKATSAVQRGNLQIRSGVSGNDEIGRFGVLFDQMLDRVNEMIAEVSDTQTRKRIAELRMLQAQINPHFLFNVLNSIRMKVLRRGDSESAKMIGSLSALLRMTISREEDEITLHDELELVSHYMSLMNLRQKEEVELRMNIEPEALFIKVPRLFLQPLVENALIHGLNQQAGVIRIDAEVTGDTVTLSVADNGRGMDATSLEQLNHKLNDEASLPLEEKTTGAFSGIGLLNVVERMRMLYGEDFHIHILSDVGMGTKIEMQVPRREENSNV